MATVYQSLWESTNMVLNQAVVWIKQITMSCTQKYFPELIQMPCKHSQNRLWRKKRKKLKEVLGERAKLGLDSPLWPFLHPCLWWTELPSHWRPGYDLAFLKTLLELLNNQFKNKRAFLPLRWRVFFFLQSNLVTNSYPTARECRNHRKGLWFHVAITLPVSWAEICFWATSSSNLMMLFKINVSFLTAAEVNKNNQVAHRGVWVLYKLAPYHF